MSNARRRALRAWRPSADQMKQWPTVSGNAINGLGEKDARRPSPVFWHPPDTIPHGPVMRFFYAQPQPPEVAEARRARLEMEAIPAAPLAAEAVERSPEAWSAAIKQQAKLCGADVVGITRMRQEWVFEGHTVPQKWIIVLGVEMDYEELRHAPAGRAAAEVHRQYGRGIGAAKKLANWLREQGHDAFGYGGPQAGSFVMIPPAIEAGLGELGKHGSLINRELGSSFRLACVLTDLPLVADRPDIFGADDFCTHCRLCMDECPPDALSSQKQMVRGVERWYVDFDKCLPYFAEHHGCAICLAVCPWSRPGVAENLLVKLGERRARGGS